MGSDELCWCGSGDLWIACHRGRGRAREVGSRESLARLETKRRNPFCSHPEAPKTCVGPTIRAHSLQKSTSLKAISEDGEVYAVRGGIDSNGNKIIKKIGINNASTFFGFCNHHDTTMFRPIESGEIPLDKRAAFLLSFRSVAMEILERENVIRTMKRNRFDAGRPLKEQESIVNDVDRGLRPIILGKSDFEEWKLRLDKMYASENYDDMNMVIVEFDGCIPVLASSAIQPWFDFDGNILQKLNEIDHPEKLSLCLTYTGNNSALVFCWDGGSDSAGKRLVDSFLKQPDNLKATASVLLALGYTENAFMRKSWWDSLYPRQQERSMDIMNFGTGGPENKSIIKHIMDASIAPFRIKTYPKLISWL